MRNFATVSKIGITVFLLIIYAFAQSNDTSAVSKSEESVISKDTLTTQCSKPMGLNNITISGFGWFEFGQIMHGWYGNAELNHAWQESFDTRLDMTAPISNRLTINIGTEIWYQYSTVVAQTNGPSYLPGVNVIIDRADADYTIFDGNFPLTLQAGYFKFKYNAEATNLGEYLFRSGCYPTFVTNDFDFPMARLLGFNLENTLFKDNSAFSAHQNLLLTSETQLYPYEDLSLSYLASVNAWNNVFTFGGGICGQRMFSVNQNNTTPHDPRSISSVTNIKDTVDANGIPITTGDTTFFSFAGTKVMAHAAFDPKPLFNSGIFGSEDLKLYGEIAILGLKNYPIYKDSTIRYDLLSERMPLMVGFNFPTFRILDVLSLEFEYFKNRYYNSYYNEIVGNGTRLPLPYIQARGDQTGIDSTGWAHDVKWSVYAKKSLGKNMQIVAQFARDHRQAFINLSDPRYGDYGDNLTTPRDWYYMIKLAYGF